MFHPANLPQSDPAHPPAHSPAHSPAHPLNRPLNRPLGRSLGLGSELADRLAEWISGGGAGPGERLPTEKQLVERYGVSRAVVREAIARLKADGYVETRQGAGAFVAARPGQGSFRLGGETDLADIFDLRAAVEAKAAELAARRHRPQDIAAIREAYQAMQQALQSGAGGAAADDAFHAAIANASGNPHLGRFLDYLAGQLSASRALTWSAQAIADGRAAATQAEHAAILAAIEAGDAAQAAAAAASHIENAARRARENAPC